MNNAKKAGPVGPIDFENRHYARRHRDFEQFDEITLKVVPRWKESYMSGDEWRTSVHVQFLFKGLVAYERAFSDMRSALLGVGLAWLEQSSPIPNSVLAREKDRCFQPGCSEKATARWTFRELFSPNGERLSDQKLANSCYCQFCDKHSHRGDCGLEDADRNLELIDILD